MCAHSWQRCNPRPTPAPPQPPCSFHTLQQPYSAHADIDARIPAPPHTHTPAIVEAEAPEGGHGRAPDDRGVLLHDGRRRWPQKEVEVQDAPRHPASPEAVCVGANAITEAVMYAHTRTACVHSHANTRANMCMHAHAASRAHLYCRVLVELSKT